jgi:hypothetical protein
LDFVRSFNPYEGVLSKEDKEDPHATWRALIRQYGFTHIDEFDAVILQGVGQGRVDTATLKASAEKQDRHFQLQDKNRSFSTAWDAYHDSFDDNAEAVLDGLENAIRTNAPAIPPANLSSTITFLKEMGRGEKVKELIQEYVNSRAEPPEFWDLSKYSFRGEIKDPDVIDAFKRKLDTSAERPDPIAVLDRIANERGWNPEDVEFLASLSADDFRTIFKTRHGLEMRRAIYGALIFQGVSNADEKMKAVTKNAEEALRKIGGESRINARRVRQFGIDIGSPDDS